MGNGASEFYEVTAVVDPEVVPEAEFSGVVRFGKLALLTQLEVVLPAVCFRTGGRDDLKKVNSKYLAYDATENPFVRSCWVALGPLVVIHIILSKIEGLETVANYLLGVATVLGLVVGVIFLWNVRNARSAIVHFYVSRRYLRRRVRLGLFFAVLSVLLVGGLVASILWIKTVDFGAVGQFENWVKGGVFVGSVMMGAAVLIAWSVVAQGQKLIRGPVCEGYYSLKKLSPVLLGQLPDFVPVEEKNS